MAANDVIFATCAPGLEPVLHAEIKALRLSKVEQQVGGVRFEGKLGDIWRCNLELRTAIRVLRRLARFSCRDADTLYETVHDLPWERWLKPGGTVVVDAQTRDSELSHSLFLEQRTKDAIVDRVQALRGDRPAVDLQDADLRVHVHVWNDRATISLDSSGPSLHKRGWRVHQGLAPLSETTAAGMIALSDWNGRAPVVDPFCGSGTILVEAAHRAMNRAPGIERTFAFERWPEHDEAAWEKLRSEARLRVKVPRKLRLVGTDIDPERVQQARENLEAAGAGDLANIECCDAREIELRPGWNASILSNLPYGVRVGGGEDDLGDLVDLFRGFGAHLREQCAGYEVTLLSGDKALTRALALKPFKRFALQNGALPVDLLRIEIAEKS